MAKIKKRDPSQLFTDVAGFIEESKKYVAYTANATLTLLYWKMGKRINDELLKSKRGDYGKQIVVTLSRQLEETYGKGFEEKNLRRIVQFAAVFPDEQIVVSLIRQLTWSHFITLIPIKDELQREFYTEMCRIERWSVRTLREKIDSMLYERTAISKKPELLIKQQLKALRKDNVLTPDLVFRDTYMLGFLGLKNIYSEKILEDAILQDLEQFIMELGQGFTFVERQKRMIIDGEDFNLDLLFYHRKLKRLVAVDLKLGKFKAGYKSQMELYLRWLEKNEMQDEERTPLGLLLCTEGSREQIELLQLDKSGIKIAEYLTELPSKRILKQKLQKTIELAKERFENKESS